ARGRHFATPTDICGATEDAGPVESAFGKGASTECGSSSVSCVADVSNKAGVPLIEFSASFPAPDKAIAGTRTARRATCPAVNDLAVNEVSTSAASVGLLLRYRSDAMSFGRTGV